jgi:hypothetical protein
MHDVTAWLAGNVQFAARCLRSCGSTMHETCIRIGSRNAIHPDKEGPGGNTVQIEQTVVTARIGDCS